MRLVSRTKLFALAPLCLVLSVATGAEAQRKEDKSNSQFYLNRGSAGGPAADVARQRARSGDCKGALLAFDEAVRLTIEPTLRRDRGMCHEKLEHVYPAIDDYRAYLHARPDAPDADDIRARLGRLEEAAGVGGPSPETGSDDGYEKSSSSSKGSANASVSIGTSGASSKADGETTDSARSKPTKNYDSFRRDESKLDAAEDSPLRLGTGLILGPYAGPRWFVGEGANSDTAFQLGATVRYATSSTFTLMADLGYVQQGDSNRVTGAGGFGGQLAAELRLHLNQTGDQAIILGAGPGFERYIFSATRTANNVLLGRGRLGFRFVFGPAIALEFTFDPAVAYIMPEGGGPSRVNGVLGGGAAFLVAF